MELITQGINSQTHEMMEGPHGLEFVPKIAETGADRTAIAPAVLSANRSQGAKMENGLDLSSLFADNRERVATTFDTQGFRFFLRAWSEEAKQRNRTTAQRWAATLGLTPEKAKEVEFDAFHADKLQAFHEEERAFYIRDNIMGIGLTLGEKSKEENMEAISADVVLRMRADVVVPLVDFIIAFNRDGTLEDEFFRKRGK